MWAALNMKTAASCRGLVEVFFSLLRVNLLSYCNINRYDLGFFCVIFYVRNLDRQQISALMNSHPIPVDALLFPFGGLDKDKGMRM